MTTKLAGQHLPLQEMIANVLDDTRTKLAAAEEKEEKKPFPFAKKKDDKKEEKDEDKEKKSFVINVDDPDEVEKLAAALDEMAEDITKEADSVENGGESHQGGQQLPTMGMIGGKQVYTGAKATPKHQVPVHTGLITAKDDHGAKTAVPTDDNRAPGGNGAKYPAKGVLKTGSVQVLEAALDKIKTSMAALDKMAAEKKETEQERAHRYGGTGAAIGAGLTGASALHALTNKGARQVWKKHPGLAAATVGTAGAINAAVGYGAGRLAHRVAHGPTHEGKKVKESSAIEFILDKVAEFHGGGETLDSKSGQGPKPAAAPGRQLIANNAAPAKATKREAKVPVKKPLSEVLTEPALTSSTDNTVQQNLRNAAKGGVKIAAVKEFLRKVADAGCVCANQGECDYCKMKASLEKKRMDRKVKESIGTGSPAPTLPMSGPSPVPGSMA